MVCSDVSNTPGSESIHSYIADSSCKLGDMYRVLGKLNEVLKLIERSLQIRRDKHGTDEVHSDIADSMRHLALVE